MCFIKTPKLKNTLIEENCLFDFFKFFTIAFYGRNIVAQKARFQESKCFLVFD